MTKLSDRNILRRLEYWPLLVSLLSAGLATLFLVALIRFTPDQSRHFLIFIAGLFPVLFVLTRLMIRPRERGIARYWKSFREGRRLTDHNAIRRSYGQIMNHPRFLFLQGLGFWTAGTLLVASYMALFQGVSGFSFLKICFAGLSSGTLSSFFLFHVSKRILCPVRESFQTYRDVEEIAKHVQRITLRTKLLATFVSLVFVTLAFSALMFYEQTLRAVERTRLDASHPVFDSIRSELSRIPFADAGLPDLGAIARRAGLAPDYAVALFDAGGKQLAFAGEERPEGTGSQRLSTSNRGSGKGLSPGHVILEDQVPGKGWRLALTAPTGLAKDQESSLHRMLAVQLLLSLLVAIGLAVLAANDVNNALRSMAQWSRRVALGDLSTTLSVESEDELGQLAHSLSDMSRRLRRMFLHVLETSDGVEKMSTEVSAVAQVVAIASDEQNSSVLEATSVFEEINASIRGIAEHTEHLSVSAEESSSSILEMGATVEEVSGNMESLSRSVDESVSSMEEMTGAIREVARNVEGLSEVAEATGASMEEMAASVRQVEENAVDSRRLSLEMVKAAETGSERVFATISGIEAIRSSSEEAQQVISSLGRRAEEIGDILDVIDDVAEETNLLALNAAIIAAQAGEHGRGFSVVANEIKDLADRVGASTKEIGKVIKAVQDESENAISAVRRGGEMVAEGERLSRDAGRALEEIMVSARSSGELIGEIAQAATDQAKGSHSVVVAMEHVRDLVSQIRGAMEEQSRGSDQVMAASISMRDIAQQVKGTIHEQARGSGRITVSIENIRDMVQQINGAIQEQRHGTEQAVEALGHIRERAEQNQDAAGKMSGVVEGMVAQANVLKREVSRFGLRKDRDDSDPDTADPPVPEVKPSS